MASVAGDPLGYRRVVDMVNDWSGDCRGAAKHGSGASAKAVRLAIRMFLLILIGGFLDTVREA